MIKLHHHPASTYARRVRIAFIEKQIPHELIEVDMRNGAHRAPAFLAMNPYHRVPVLEEDGFVLYESAAILEYLEGTHPTPALVPADAKGRALVDMHLRLCDLQMGRPMGQIIFPKRFLPRDKWNVEVIAQASKDVEEHLAILERQLGRAEYLVANRFSLADVAYMPFMHFIGLTDAQVPPAVAAWSKRILARPSAQETVPPM